MSLVEELRSKKSRDNRDLLDRAADRIEELELLLINEDKSNNFDFNSNKQIEQMARDICPLNVPCEECTMLAKQMGQSKDQYCKPLQYAKRAYEKGWRKQSEGEWKDRYNGKYANSIYECSLCKEKALWKIGINELGSPKITQTLAPFCPNCGAKMKGGE